MERVQSAAGLDRVFSPRAVAVIGASPREESVGNQVLRNILAAGFTGPSYAVHPTAKEVLGRPSFPTIAAVPKPVDLAVVAVPARLAMDIVRQCADAGVQGIVMLTAGFAEAGPDGVRLQEDLVALVRLRGLRLIGPNCLGVMNLDPAVRLNATFASAPARPGTTALVTQSGALGIALLQQAARLGLGVARFASMGNKADVSGNDLLLQWEDDPGVGRIVLYLESFGNPRNFLAIARRVGRRKPILIVKAGRTARGSAAARSHTAAMAEPDVLVDALVEQCGVVRANTVQELFDAAVAFDLQPPPKGDRVAIVTNSGGPAILATDALAAAGLRPADLSEATLARLRPLVPPEGSPGNPLDLLAGATPSGYRSAIAALADDAGVDAILAIYTPVHGEAEVVRAITESARGLGKTLACVCFGQGPEDDSFRQLTSARVPAYTFPEDAVRALGAMVRWREHADRPAGTLPPSRPVPTFLGARGPGWADPSAALDLAATLAAVPRSRRVSSATDAGSAADAIGVPVVLKAVSPTLVHKSDAGGVRLGLADAGQVRRAYEEMARRLREGGHRMDGALVMREERAGRDVLVGVVQDEHFGPVVSVGLGGIHTEVFHDVAVRLAPVTDDEARRMVRSLRAWPILAGVRGEAPADTAALERLLCDVSRLAADAPRVAEFELNPVRLFDAGKGLAVLDARLRLA